MANVIIQSTNTNLTKIVFHDMTRETAITIANHMNKLNEDMAKKMGETVKMIFRVIGS